MFIANYGLKSFVQKAAMVARLPIAYSQDHPYTGLKERARRETLDFITEVMPEALAFDTPRELMRHALSLAMVEGLYAEFGVNNGGTITYIAKQKPSKTIHGFDSFEGLPEDWSGNAMAAGFFNRKGQLPKVPANVVLHPGWFDRTAPKFAAENSGPLAFLHVDCDLYSSTATIFSDLGDRIVPGTVIMFDEYFNYPNWKAHEHKAFTEFQEISGKKFRHLGYSIQQVAAVAL
ncbi:MAG TPA: class I SAM-dependent methyltransferase [Hyphomicrobium sp.]|nr:class I SAM-dependent methyltransferase [Hyphomicrobium sp.]